MSNSLSRPPNPGTNNPPWLDQALKQAWEKSQKILAAQKQLSVLTAYQADPVSFGEEILGDRYTEDVKRVMRSVRDNPITIAKSGNAVGKSQPVDTPVPTPEGWRKIGELNVGDQVFAVDGSITTVVGVFPQGEQPTFRVGFNDGTSVLASADHLWAVRTSSDQYRERPYRMCTTEQLTRMTHRHTHIPMCAPVEYLERQLPIDPYVMGVLLGDGALSNQTIRFTSNDDEIVERVAQSVGELRVNRYSHKIAYGIVAPGRHKNPMIGAARSLGLLGAKSVDKFIPRDYLQASVQQRTRLLQGLMDTDGYISKTHSMQFSTISPRLARDVQELVWSLGGTAKLFTKRPFYRSQGVKIEGQLAYTLNIKIGFCPFLLQRKVDRYMPQEDMQKHAQRIVEGVEFVGMMDSTCIRIAHPSRLYLSENYTVTHNSHGSARVAVWFFKVFPDSQVYLIAAPPLDNLKRVLWGEVLTVTDAHKPLFAMDTIRSLSIVRNPKSFIAAVAIPTSGTEAEREAKFSGKHAPNILFIVDEGDAVPDEVYRGIDSCMSSDNARLLIMFNPRAQIGPVYDMEHAGKANVVQMSAMSHPNVSTGRNIIPGAVSRDITVRRINEWTRPAPPNETIGTFSLPDFLHNATAQSPSGTMYEPLKPGNYKIVEPQFAYMVLGEYPPQGEAQLISSSWIEAAVERWKAYVHDNGEEPPQGVEPVMSVDVAELGVDANVATMRYGGFVKRQVFWSGVDIDASANQALITYNKYKPKIAYIDSTGIGAGVAPLMVRIARESRQKIHVFSIKVSNKPTPGAKTELGEFFSLRDQLWWSAREWLRTDPTSMLPPDPFLLAELRAPTYSVRANGKIKITDKDTLRSQLKRSTDRADSLCLTFMPLTRATITRLEH